MPHTYKRKKKNENCNLEFRTTEEKKKTVIENYGEEKWRSMITHLNDPEKIMWTYAHILPNFLLHAVENLQLVEV